MDFNNEHFVLTKDDLQIMESIEDHILGYGVNKNIYINIEFDKFIRNFKLDNILNNIVYSDLEILNIVENYINTQHSFVTINDFRERRNYILEKLIDKKI